MECIGGQVEPYPYYDGEDIDWDWELDRSEGLQPDVDRYVALCERARAITADVDPDTSAATRSAQVPGAWQDPQAHKPSDLARQRRRGPRHAA